MLDDPLKQQYPALALSDDELLKAIFSLLSNSVSPLANPYGKDGSYAAAISHLPVGLRPDSGVYSDIVQHIKVTLPAIFTFAKRKGIYDGVNPMTGVSIPKGKKHGRKRLAYSLDEVEQHLELFSGSEPIVIPTEHGPYTPDISQAVVRAVIGVAAFAGLREGEIRGQWWEDDEGGDSQHPTFRLADSSQG
jgi:hypothetical protein